VDSLVVLPFVNLTGLPEHEYFSDGLTEELTNALAHLQGVRVVARTTAFQFKGKARDIRSIAEQLHVSAVLEGSVRRQDNKLRVTVQLNDARSGYHIWSQVYDREEGDIWKLQEDISNQVARTIRPDSHSILAATGSRDLEAYNLCLLGRFHRSKPDASSKKRAVSFFQQAIQKDPRYAAAYAGLAESYITQAWDSLIPPLEALTLAQKAADQALTLDDNLAEAHTSQAIVHLQLDWNWKAAEQHFQRAIALNDNNAEAHHWFSHYYIAMGEFSKSLAQSQRALELDPLDVRISGHLCWHYLQARDYPNAIKAGLQTLELDPHSRLAFTFLAWVYEDAAQWDNAIDAWQRGSDIHPDAHILQEALRADGPRGYWRARLAFVSKQAKAANYWAAVLHARLGESDKAVERLERAFQMREPELIVVKREPAFDWMQSNPRYRELTNAMKLP
jgi:TolB-like protein/Tfp pilus assembly protein PilF